MSSPELTGVEMVQNPEKAISVIKGAGEWLKSSGREVSKWWDPDNVSVEFLSEYAKPEDYFCVEVDGAPAAAAMIQTEQNAQDWSPVDNGSSKDAVYIHWLAVNREFSGQGLPLIIVEFAEEMARENDCEVVRVDVDEGNQNLVNVYLGLNFRRVKKFQEDSRMTGFYERSVF